MRRKTYLLIFAVSLLLILIMQSLLSVRYRSRYRVSDQQRDGAATWEFTLHDTRLGTSDTVLGPEYLKKGLLKGDCLILETTLQETEEAEIPAICFRLCHCAAKLYLNGKLYRSCDMDRYESGSFLGRNTYLITLPRYYEGITLSMYLYPEKDGIRRPLTELFIGDYNDLQGYLIQSNFIALTAGALLIIVGMILLVIAIAFSVKNQEFVRSILSAFMIILLGVILHSCFGLSSFYQSWSRDTDAFYYAIYLLAPLTAIWAGAFPGGRKRIVYWWLMLAFLVYTLTRMLLHANGGLYLDRGFFLLAPLTLLFLGWTLADFMRGEGWKQDSSQHLQYFGMEACVGLLLVAAGFTFLANHVWIARGEELGFLAKSALCAGAVMFPLCQIVNYLRYGSRSFRNKAEYDDLTRVAFEDVLTGLPNRASLSYQVEQIEKEKSNYAVISIDVNGLKKINDQYGHAEGDFLLQGFAGSLREVFGRKGVCGRIGGDEFVVLMRNSSTEKLDELLFQLEIMLAQRNKTEQRPWRYAAACGYAFSFEAETFHDVYLLADQRMYDHKKAMKKT